MAQNYDKCPHPLGAKAEKVKVWLTSANNFSTGSQDSYTLLCTVPLGRQPALLGGVLQDCAGRGNNTVNRWLTSEKPGPKAEAR